MKLTRKDAREIARAFKAGRGRAWNWTTLHDEIIDAEVMDAVRRSWTADSTTPVTPAELIAFRDVLERELGHAGFRTARYEDEMREQARQAQPSIAASSLTTEQIHVVRKAMLGVPRKKAYHRAILADCGGALDGDAACRESVERAYNKMLGAAT